MTSTLRETPGFGRFGEVGALITALRPGQWSKNLLVFVAPLAAGLLFQAHVFAVSLGAFVALSLAASGSYLVNDVIDADLDRAHPRKRRRPVAAGRLTAGAALLVAVPLFGAGLGIAFSIRLALGLTVAAYVLVTLSYSVWLKREPVIELALLSLAFLLRAVAGGAAGGIPLSKWFLMVAAFGSLFMAAGKRASELGRVRQGLPPSDEEMSLGPVRDSLAGYTPGYLRFVWSLAATVTVAGYCLWAFDVADRPSSLPWAFMSVLPFVLGVLRYALEIDRGAAEAPELVIMRSPVLLGLGLLWVLLFGLGASGV